MIPPSADDGLTGIDRHLVYAVVLGIPVQFETDAEVLPHILTHFSAVQTPPPNARGDVVVVRCTSVDLPWSVDEARVRYQVEPRRMFILGNAAFGVADRTAHKADVFIGRSRTPNAVIIQRGVLEAVVLFLATASDRFALHAATVSIGGRTVVLIGRSGSGKSSLAYAAHTSGFRVYADDVAYVGAKPEMALWTFGRQINLTPSLRDLFPELDQLDPVVQPNGKTKISIALGGHGTDGGQDCVLVLLTPGAVTANIEELTWDELQAHMFISREPGFDLTELPSPETQRWMKSLPRWRLHLSSDPREAVDVLARHLASS